MKINLNNFLLLKNLFTLKNYIMNFSDIIKKNSQKLKQNKNMVKENIEPVSKNIVEYVETDTEKWTSYFSYDIIKLFSNLQNDFNLILGDCNINEFFNFTLTFSKIYNPYSEINDSDSEDEPVNDDEYISD